MTLWRMWAGLWAVLVTATSVAATPTLANGQSTLRVCQDPNNMPFSNSQGQGIENKLAELLGQAWGVPVSYYAFPQRMGFIRNTLRYKLPGEDYPCDIVMGVPAGFDQVATTTSYYRSAYALVFPLGKDLDAVHSVEDFLNTKPALLHKLRMGVYDRSPASAWLSRHGLEDAGVPYKLLNADPNQYPGEIIERDLAKGQIDVAIVWGPMAAYFAHRVQSPSLRVIPMRSEPGVTLEFDMAMGVRHGKPAWKAQVNAVLQSHQAHIQSILQTFDVPLLARPHDTAHTP
jgi:mxaJ protein